MQCVIVKSQNVFKEQEASGLTFNLKGIKVSILSDLPIVSILF